MSNPGIIKLDTVPQRKGLLKKNFFSRFEIEDNLGEAVHIHLENMRIDLTIKEYLAFSKTVKDSLKKLDLLKGFPLENFDFYFLKECSEFLEKLEKIKVEEVKLSDLKFVKYKKLFGKIKIINLIKANQIPAYKYLKGDKEEFLNYDQYNYFNLDNEKRLSKLKKSIEKNGYPYEKKFIVLFEGQNVVRDGQHRAAILAYKNPAAKIKVLRFYFSDKKHTINPLKSNLRFIVGYFVKKSYFLAKKINRKLRV